MRVFRATVLVSIEDNSATLDEVKDNLLETVELSFDNEANSVGLTAIELNWETLQELSEDERTKL